MGAHFFDYGRYEILASNFAWEWWVPLYNNLKRRMRRTRSPFWHPKISLTMYIEIFWINLTLFYLLSKTDKLEKWFSHTARSVEHPKDSVGIRCTWCLDAAVLDASTLEDASLYQKNTPHRGGSSRYVTSFNPETGERICLFSTALNKMLADLMKSTGWWSGTSWGVTFKLWRLPP